MITGFFLEAEKAEVKDVNILNHKPYLCVDCSGLMT